MTDNPIDPIKAQLEHPYIRERQAALKKLAALLDQNDHVRACVELLQGVVKSSEYLIVADVAQQILDTWQHKNQVVRTRDDRQHIFGAVCPQCGHQNYYDKREVCASSGSIFLGKATDQSDEILLECQQCHASFVVHVNCEGYR